MSQTQTRKAPYYPQVVYTIGRTQFGAIETDVPNLYEKAIKGLTIVRYDALAVLKDVYGENIYRDRDRLYKLVSGSVDNDTYVDILVSFYRKYSAFTNHVDSVFSFGNRENSDITKVISPMRDLVDEEIDRLFSIIQKTGGRVVMHTHDYIYCVYKHDLYPKCEGSKVIC